MKETPTTESTLLDSRGEPLKEPKSSAEATSWKESNMDIKGGDPAKRLTGSWQDEKQGSTKDLSKKATVVVGQVGEGAKEVSRTANAATGHATQGAKEILSDAREGAKGVANAAQNAAGHAVETGKEVVEDLKEGAKNLANTAMTTAGEAKEVVQAAGSEVAGIVKEVTDRATHTVVDAIHEVRPTIRRANRAAGAFVASNAVPISLVGFGAGWLLMSGRRRRPSATPDLARSLTSSAASSALASESKPSIGMRGSQARQQSSSPGEATSLTEATTEVVHEAAEVVQEAASSVREGVKHVGAEARARASELKQRAAHQIETAREVVSERAAKLKKGAGERLDRAKQSTTHLAESSPFALIALSLGAGMGTAMLFPSSKPEKRLMGAARDRLVDEASETASRVGGVARETARNLRDNLHP